MELNLPATLPPEWKQKFSHSLRAIAAPMPGTDHIHRASRTSPYRFMMPVRPKNIKLLHRKHFACVHYLINFHIVNQIFSMLEYPVI